MKRTPALLLAAALVLLAAGAARAGVDGEHPWDADEVTVQGSAVDTPLEEHPWDADDVGSLDGVASPDGTLEEGPWDGDDFPWENDDAATGTLDTLFLLGPLTAL